MKFIIISPEYQDQCGGAIVLHKLCHILNKIGMPAYLHPTRQEYSHNIAGQLRKKTKEIKLIFKKYKTNPNFNTPLIRYISKKDLESCIVIYPESTDGNPLGAKYVVRWFLHQPGFHTGKINYYPNELYFKFNSCIHEFNFPGSYLSKNELKVIHYPIDIYNTNDMSEVRNIPSCHLIRKGKDKKKVHSDESICIDNMSHREIASIFKKAKEFICYDDYTAYSIFAVLCGCESIVVPSDNVSIEDWYPNTEDRYGISYGFSEEQKAWAEQTKHKVLEHILGEHKKSENNVKVCAEEMRLFFNLGE